MSALPKHILTATALGNVSVLTQWINDGGDPNARTIDGHTLPSVAAIFCRLDSMTVLVERGARVDVADGDGWTVASSLCARSPSLATKVTREEDQKLMACAYNRRAAPLSPPLPPPKLNLWGPPPAVGH